MIYPGMVGTYQLRVGFSIPVEDGLNDLQIFDRILLLVWGPRHSLDDFLA